MNRGYAAYLKESKAAVKETFSNKGSYIKYFIWLLITSFGRLLLLPTSAMDLSNIKLSKDVLEKRQIALFNSFDGCFKAKPFWSLFLSKLLYALFVISALIVIVFLSILYFLFFDFVSSFFTETVMEVIIMVTAVPVYIFILCFMISVIFRAAPMIYVAYTDDNAQPSKVLSKSFKAMNQGKFTLFLNYLRVFWFTLLFSIVAFAIVFAYEYIVVTFFLPSGGQILGGQIGYLCELINYNLDIDLVLYISRDVEEIIFAITSIIELGMVIATVIALFRFIARLSLTNMVATYALFEDLVDDKFNQNKVAVGVFVKSVKNKKVKDISLKDVFASSDSVSCDATKASVEKRVLQDLSEQITLDEELNKSFEKTSTEVTEWVY